MRRIFLTISLTLFLTANLQAQDAKTFDWSGFYFGGDIGYLNSQVKNNIFDTFASTAHPNPEGGVAGIHVGYRKQFPSSLVLGIEIDAWASDTKGFQKYSHPLVLGNAQLDVRAGVSVRFVVGRAIDSWLLYATGGVAVVGFKGCATTGTYDCSFASNYTDNKEGYIAGFGIARALTENIIIRIEFLNGYYGTQTYGSLGFFGGRTQVEDLNVQTVRTGLSWKF